MDIQDNKNNDVKKSEELPKSYTKYLTEGFERIARSTSKIKILPCSEKVFVCWDDLKVDDEMYDCIFIAFQVSELSCFNLGIERRVSFRKSVRTGEVVRDEDDYFNFPENFDPCSIGDNKYRLCEDGIDGEVYLFSKSYGWICHGKHCFFDKIMRDEHINRVLKFREMEKTTKGLQE